ncbi:MAG: hypothetical protein LBI49_25805 [Nocardiopsaceae bacterium]|nr:hypothetical protein [Nocardiopsaceae bacterium]
MIEIERTVSGSGNISVGNHVITAGLPLAGQRVTLRLDGPLAHILTGTTLARTVACPVTEQARPRLRGARAGTAGPPQMPQPQVVQRRVSVRGAIMIGGQRIQPASRTRARPPKSPSRPTPTRSRWTAPS